MWHYLFYLAYNYQSKKDWICVILRVLLKAYPIQECGLQSVFTDSASLDSASSESKVLKIPESITDFICVCPCQGCTESVRMRQGVSTPHSQVSSLSPTVAPPLLSGNLGWLSLLSGCVGFTFPWHYHMTNTTAAYVIVMFCQLCLAICPFFKVHRGYI